MPFKREVIQCHLCDAKFQRWSLKQHVEKVHEGKIYECHICYQEFPYRASLRLHIDAVHEQKHLIVQFVIRVLRRNPT